MLKWFTPRRSRWSSPRSSPPSFIVSPETWSVLRGVPFGRRWARRWQDTAGSFGQDTAGDFLKSCRKGGGNHRKMSEKILEILENNHFLNSKHRHHHRAVENVLGKSGVLEWSGRPCFSEPPISCDRRISFGLSQFLGTSMGNGRQIGHNSCQKYSEVSTHGVQLETHG